MQMADPSVRVLELKPGGHWDSNLFKLKTGWVLRFTIAPCLYATDIKLYTDYPTPGTLYKRGQLRELQWQTSSRKPTWDPDRHVDVALDYAGPYRFEYKRDGCESLEGSGYFVVDPDLGYSPDGISCQTHITKLMGPLTEWKERLQVSKEAGYNMVHFTPINQLGSSRSAYSISNQLRMDSSYLPTGYTTSDSKASFKNAEGVTKSFPVESSFLKVRDLVKSLHRDWGMLSLVDVVWNHTSFDTPWLLQHPEAGYNLVNSPHLRPAYALDVVLSNFSYEIAEGQWEKLGIRPEIQSEGDIYNICTRLRDIVLPRAQLWEYFCVDVEAIVENFRSTVYRLNGGNHPRPEGKALRVIQDPQYRRLGSGVDTDLTLELFNVDWPGLVCFEERMERCTSDLRETLRRLNKQITNSVNGQLEAAISNLAANIRYQYLEGHGPRKQRVTKEDPLFPRFFCMVGGGADLQLGEIEGTRGEYVLAHNGWVMNADPLVNFAADGSLVYFKRELIVWGDSVKLRYGDKPEDSPWLWQHMKQYTQTMAWIFDGFRLDNCHNTPLNVAEGLLDAAREVNPNLYLVAELFTPCEEKDNYFVNRLGINSLVREAMFASYARELGRLVYKYGGEPVASFMPPATNHVLKPTVTHAMFMDATHDNDPGHILSRSVYDALPNTALVAIASCASGGTRGYDELVPHMINVVSESRQYAKWSNAPSPTDVGPDTGIMKAKAELNKLHIQLADQGFNQIYVDQVTEEIVAVTRHSPKSHQSVILMAHTAFHHPEEWAIPTQDRPHTHWSHVPPLTVPGLVKEVVLEARLVKKSPDSSQFKKEAGVINGLQSHVLDMRTHIQLEDSKFCRLTEGGNGNTQEVAFTEFPPGSIIAFRVSLVPEACSAISHIRSFLTSSSESPEGYLTRQRVDKACSSLDLFDLNYALYRCDAEERDDGQGGGVYEVPGAGKLVYCGLQGIMSMMTWVRDNNDLGHPLCCNLRDGDWMAGYTANRLKLRDGTKQLGELLSGLFDKLSKIPRYLIPCYFDAIVSTIHQKLVDSAIGQMGKFIQEGSSLVQGLALGSVQLYGICRSAILPASSPSDTPSASLAAGLPHFSTGFMRCWGRDTFIALRGLLLVTNRYEEARDNLLSFGACVRHGLIPNLLNGGANPRYNCRDAPWWWLQSIQDFCTMAPYGCKILQDDVRKLYRNEDDPADFTSTEVCPLSEVIQEVLRMHVQGINFRERGAGPNLDRDMSPPGFNVQAGVDLLSGFVYGGNVHNCGTWMDKVGESSWSGNKGVPATPRDGSAVELVGLCYSAVSWLSKLFNQGLYPYSGVKLPSEPGAYMVRKFSFQEWAKTIKTNFEARFWIPEDLELAREREGEEAGYIHRLGIFKDSVGATQRYSDYRLRPNFPIAMVVAPDLFTPGNAWTALCRAEEILVGPLGMRTLDPNDYVFNGYYINSVDSGDFNSAKGFNYHQGPEWLWVIGYFLRAKLQFARRNNLPIEETVSSIHKVLSAHAQALRDSPWKGLPELTNKDGAECPDSCPVQSWSMATLLDVLHDMGQYSS